jgi:thioesterase domain-containing protein
VYGLQPETRADGSFVHTRIDEMASAYVARIQAVQPHGPYLIAGLCAGGVIAFEMARQLQDSGENVRFVGIIDAADVEAAARPFYITLSRLRRLGDLLSFRGGSTARLLTIAPILLRKLTNAISYEVTSRLERLRHHRAVAQMRDTAAEGGNTATFALSFLQLYQVAHRQHRPRGLLSGCDVVLYKATQGTGAADDVPFGQQYSDCIMGWGKRVAEAVRLVEIPGGHTSSLQEPNVTTLARAMQNDIDTALDGHGTKVVPLPRHPAETPAIMKKSATELLPQ